MREFVAGLVEPEVHYQRFLITKVHQPNNIYNVDWHKDKGFNHNVHEINLYRPMTRAHDADTVWAERLDRCELRAVKP
jgi:hypothetical protein|tara:strand:+ start:2425 stop:2658 length:234 start_codon:yes stop_codon:yes gene_type:complete